MLALILMLISGAGLVLAFAPFNVFALAFLCPAVFLYFCHSAKGLCISFFRGLCFGLGFYGAGVYWVYISVHQFGGASLLLASVITALFVLVLALFSASKALMLTYFFQRKAILTVALAGFPAVWVIWEWLRELPFNGFPWLYLGYTQLDTPLAHFAPWFGVYGISLIICLISGCLMLFVSKQPTKIKLTAVFVTLCLLFSSWLLSQATWTKPSGPEIKVSLVQGNIAQSIKWDKQQLNAILKKYQALTDKHLDSTLIVWPEAAVPVFPAQAAGFIAQMSDELKQKQVNLIFGAPLTNAQDQYFNGLLLIGAHSGKYLKRHLVPFGEYTPLAFLFNPLMEHLNIPMSDFTPGDWQQPPLVIDDINIAAFICYEIAFPQQTLQAAKHSNVLLTISDDSWFGDSIALSQHLQMAQMRALETGRYLLLASNTGITAFIAPNGSARATAPVDTSLVLTRRITPMTGLTPVMRWYYYPVICFIILLLLIVYRSRPLSEEDD